MDESLFELSQMQTRRQLMGRSALGLRTAALAGLLASDRHLFSQMTQKVRTSMVGCIIGRLPNASLSVQTWSVIDCDYAKVDGHVQSTVAGSRRNDQRITGMTANQKAGLPLSPVNTDSPVMTITREGPGSVSCCPTQRGVVSELCVVRSTFTEAINHDPAILHQTGQPDTRPTQFGRWLSYGLEA